MGQLDYLVDNTNKEDNYIMQWHFMTIPKGSSLDSELEIYKNSNYYLNNAYTYIGNTTIQNEVLGRVTGADTTFRANSTLLNSEGNGLQWSSIVDYYGESAVQKFGSWDNSPLHNLVDITPYYKHTFDSGTNSSPCMACWVQLSNKMIDINTDFSPSSAALTTTDLFINSGWYPIGVNSGQTIVDALGGSSIVSYDDAYGIHVPAGPDEIIEIHAVYTSKKPDGDREIIFPRYKDDDIFQNMNSYFEEVAYLNTVIPTHTVYWVNISIK